MPFISICTYTTYTLFQWQCLDDFALSDGIENGLIIKPCDIFFRNEVIQDSNTFSLLMLLWWRSLISRFWIGFGIPFKSIETIVRNLDGIRLFKQSRAKTSALRVSKMYSFSHFLLFSPSTWQQWQASFPQENPQSTFRTGKLRHRPIYPHDFLWTRFQALTLPFAEYLFSVKP